MKDIVSIQIKKREYYRPIAPIVLEDMAPLIFEDYFDSASNQFMLYEYKVRQEYQDVIPAVVHVDGTARAQILKEQPSWDDPAELFLLKEILEELKENYDIPCLINTSFNPAGKPILNFKEEILESGKQMGLDYIFIEDRLYEGKSSLD